ncbi:MarR family winged helix-turn-helix transcriptional regulator [Methylobacterium sp. AMS5]|uniref:MarR family winged helix-turn-helix transcriptional regulator n=1 Tax=Methylobacterium sp. AMS5 TaxID=925818 RepID=UPI00074F8470|nr:MarR family winged helix-turn-helix transcriptional regulator [Methylobacterium sp. AMS5]AMB47294.1 MarR family transcriptional regulator [Methylobacterium sp. AMS5]
MTPREDVLVGGIDIREVAACTCLRLRRTTRCVTAIYDEALTAVGLTITQFGLLAQIYGWRLQHGADPSIGLLAERVGMDATTLNRTVKPLETNGLVASGRDPSDHRIRTLCLTTAGQARLEAATAEWRKAQTLLEAKLGREATLALNALLELTVSNFDR